MLIVFTKILVIFSIIGVGFLANKTKVLPLESKDYLVRLLLTITSPCLIVSSISTKELTAETFTQTIEVMVGSLAFFIIVPFISYFLVRLLRYNPVEDRGVMMVVMTAVNTGFMGFPITKAIFGDDYFFLMVIENIVLTIYLYLIAVIQMNLGSGKKMDLKSTLKPLVNNCTLAAIISLVLLFGHIKLPTPIFELTDMIGSITVPLSMIVVGIQLGESKFSSVLKNWKLIIASGCNVILIPILTFFAVNYLPITTETKLLLVLAACFPCAVVTVAVASQEGKNAGLLAEGVALTTLFSLITLPCFCMFLMNYYC